MKYLSLLLVFILSAFISFAQITTQQISNHPVFSDVERVILVTQQMANSEAKRFELDFTVKYLRSGEDITSTIRQPTATKLIADNNLLMILRDENFNPVLDNNGEPILIGGWDYIMQLINSQVNIAQFIQGYIIINDQEGFFNQ